MRVRRGFKPQSAARVVIYRRNSNLVAQYWLIAVTDLSIIYNRSIASLTNSLHHTTDFVICYRLLSSFEILNKVNLRHEHLDASGMKNKFDHIVWARS